MLISRVFLVHFYEFKNWRHDNTSTSSQCCELVLHGFYSPSTQATAFTLYYLTYERLVAFCCACGF